MNDNFLPFRVDWILVAPMVLPDQPIHLDALLAKAQVEFDEDNATPGRVMAWDNQHDLPIGKVETESGWCFKASWLNFKGVGEPFVHFQTRKADVDMWRDAYDSGIFKKIPSAFNTGSTYTRAMLIATPMQLVAEVHAYGVGDIKKVQALLQRLPSLGKLRRRGAGSIQSVTVREVSAAECLWTRRNLPLNLPQELLADVSSLNLAPSVGGLQSPYWKRENFTTVQIPTSI